MVCATTHERQKKLSTHEPSNYYTPIEQTMYRLRTVWEGVGGVWGEEWGGEEVGGGGEARAGEGEHVGPRCGHSAILDLNRESCHRPEKLGSAVGVKICARMLKAQLMHTNANEFPLKAHLTFAH